MLMCLNDRKVSIWLTNQNFVGFREEKTPSMIFPKVLILTTFIFGTFAKGNIKNMEERFEIMERKLSALTKSVEKMEDNNMLNKEELENTRSITSSSWWTNFASFVTKIVVSLLINMILFLFCLCFNLI